jgi:hypothetical protein
MTIERAAAILKAERVVRRAGFIPHLGTAWAELTEEAFEVVDNDPVAEYKAARAAATAWKHAANAIANAKHAQGDLTLSGSHGSCAVNARRCANNAEQSSSHAHDYEQEADCSTTSALMAASAAHAAQRVATDAATVAEWYATLADDDAAVAEEGRRIREENARAQLQAYGER